MRNRLKAPENDMGYWCNPKNGKTPKDLISFLDNYKSNTQKRTDAKAGAKNVYEDNDWVVFKIETYEAAKFYGSGSKWCITGRYPGHESRGQEYFDSYLRNNYKGYWVVINKHPTDKENGEKWMVCPQKGEDKIDIWCQKDFTVSEIPGFYGDIPEVGPLGSVMVKNGVASFNTRMGNSNTRAVVLPSNVKEVADKGFYKKNVFMIQFNDGLQKIGAGAFGGNEKLVLVEIPASVKEIGRNAFIACNLNKVVLNCKLSGLPSGCFAWNDTLKEFRGLENVQVSGISADAFDDSNVTFYLGENDTEHIEFAKKIGATVVNKNTGEVING